MKADTIVRHDQHGTGIVLGEASARSAVVVHFRNQAPGMARVVRKRELKVARDALSRHLLKHGG